MNVDEASVVFSSYSLKEQEEFLAHLIYELTILARDCYEPGTDNLSNPQRMRRINELQHRVSAFLWSLLRNDSQRCPDHALMEIILEHPNDKGLEQQLNEAFARLMTQRLTVA
jgi:hypothetical protein